MFQRRFDRLKTRNNIPLTASYIDNFQNIIGFDNIPSGNYSITVSNHNTYCDISIHYTHTQTAFDLVAHNIRELPPEINGLVSEYLPSYITLELRIDYTSAYPFDIPKWSIVSCNDRLASSLKNAEEYYKYIIYTHNSIYQQHNWTPTIDIDKDILQFMIRINHFDSLFS
jgi:restriction endonuclease S subunit